MPGSNSSERSAKSWRPSTSARSVRNSGPRRPVGPDAGQMPHQLAQRHGPLLLRELRDVRLNLLVELQPVLLHQQADRRRSERLGRVPILNRVSGVTRARFSRSAQPKPSAHTMPPPTPTATESPGRFCSARPARTICRARPTASAHSCDGAACVTDGTLCGSGARASLWPSCSGSPSNRREQPADGEEDARGPESLEPGSVLRHGYLRIASVGAARDPTPGRSGSTLVSWTLLLRGPTARPGPAGPMPPMWTLL